MKILHVNKFFDDSGGAEIYMHRLMEHQRSDGHEVHAFSTRGERDLPSPDRHTFVHRYSYDKREGIVKDFKKAVNYIWNREAEKAMQRVIRELRPDVIHLHNIYHHLSTSILHPIREFRVPCVQTLHDLKLLDPNYSMFVRGKPFESCKGGKYWNTVIHRTVSPDLAPNILAAAEMFFTKLTQQYEKTVHTFLCPSEFYVNKMIEYGEPAKQFQLIRLPVELPATPASHGGGYLLFVGRVEEHKGVGTLVRACADIPTLPIRIAGRGSDVERMKHLARSLGATQISFLGFVQPEELTRLRRNAEAVVLPSVGYENSPLTILEAMADGVPVIASRIGGIPELVEDESNGLLAEPGNVEDWTRVLRRFQLLDGYGRKTMGERGRERIRKSHSWTHHLHELQRVYRRAGAR